MIKPRIKKLGGMWFCECRNFSSCANSPYEAYAEWLGFVVRSITNKKVSSPYGFKRPA